MNIKSRVGRLERAGEPEGARVRFRVVVPPKVSHEEWAARVREMQSRDGRFFTVDLDGAGRGE